MNDFWEWIDQTLVPGLYNGAWYNGNTGQPGFLNDKMSLVVGVARIRQLRVKSGKISVSRYFKVRHIHRPHRSSACRINITLNTQSKLLVRATLTTNYCFNLASIVVF